MTAVDERYAQHEPRQAQQRHAQHWDAMLVATLEATGDGILVIDLDGIMVLSNERFLEMWRMQRDEVAGHSFEPMLERGLSQLCEPQAARARLAWLCEQPHARSSELIRFLDGRVYEWTSHPQLLEDRVIGRVWGFRDVTARAQLEERLAHQAYHDALTGLANREQFRTRVERAYEHTRNHGRAADHIALLLLDLDGFKLVNDSAGHAAGDELLVQVAQRLLNATRGSDLIARIGGDEFGILLERVRNDHDVIVVADRIRSSMREAFSVGGTSMFVGASIGIARGNDSMGAPTNGEVIRPTDAIMRNADLALYQAKSRGKGQHAMFEQSLHEAALQRVSLEAQLRRGLQHGEFTLVYQPIIDLGTDQPTGFEALVRWMHPERGTIMPSDFIPLAEETGLIVPLGDWVLREACRQGALWMRRDDDPPGAQPLTVTVNVSGRQLQQPAFVNDVRRALSSSGLLPECLLLELTESTVIQYPEVALERLTAIKALGVRLAIDDFGTGYSALSYLQKFPFDVLKIDKSFVDRVAEGGQDAALASAIVGLGRALSLKTVAEGVETDAQRVALAAMGCGSGQGFLFAKPLSPSDVEARMPTGFTGEYRAVG